MAICPECNQEITHLIIREITTHIEKFVAEIPQENCDTVVVTWECPICACVLFNGSADQVQDKAENFLGLR